MVRKRQARSFLRRQHRAIGVTVAIFVLLIVLSGLALNHAHWLRLDERRITQAAVLDWYGLEAPAEVLSFPVHPQWLSFAGSRWYLDGKPVASANRGVAALAAGDWLLGADTDGLLILTRTGEVVERVSWDPGSRGNIEALGRTPGGAVAVRAGDDVWISDAELLDWSPAIEAGEQIRWARPVTAPEAIRNAIAAAHRGQAISVERLIMDLHSGRFFGSWGVVIYDLLALALASLAISGLVLWVRGRRKQGRQGRDDPYRPGQTRR